MAVARQRFIAAAAHVPKPAGQTFVLTIAHTGIRVIKVLALRARRGPRRCRRITVAGLPVSSCRWPRPSRRPARGPGHPPGRPRAGPAGSGRRWDRQGRTGPKTRVRGRHRRHARGAAGSGPRRKTASVLSERSLPSSATQVSCSGSGTQQEATPLRCHHCSAPRSIRPWSGPSSSTPSYRVPSTPTLAAGASPQRAPMRHDHAPASTRPSPA